MLLGRRRRTDIYPDADDLLHRPHRPAAVVEPADLRGAARSAGARSSIAADIPDFIRLLMVWKAAFETT